MLYEVITGLGLTYYITPGFSLETILAGADVAWNKMASQLSLDYILQTPQLGCKFYF